LLYPEIIAMPDRITPLHKLSQIARAEVEAVAAEGFGPTRPNNTHIHLPPNFSAFDSVAEAVEMAAAEGLRVLGVSNYYDYTVYDEFARRAHEAAIFPLFGTEIICLQEDLVAAKIRINDPANPGKMYICGKGISRFAPLSPEAAALLQAIRDKDSLRMRQMVERLGEVFAEAGFDAELDERQVIEMVVRRHGCPFETVYLQERHIAQAFQERMAERLQPSEQAAVLRKAYGTEPTAPLDNAVEVQNEIRSRLMKAGKPGYVPETFVDYGHARQLILALGGIPCYPLLADGVVPHCEFEATPEAVVKRLREYEVRCAEFIPNRNAPQVLREYVLALRKAGIVVTAGTEHNTRDRIPLTPACKGAKPLPEDVAAYFWEGACVVAAHQWRRVRGESGFVDETGSPSDPSLNAEERIRRFAAEGSALIESFARLAP